MAERLTLIHNISSVLSNESCGHVVSEVMERNNTDAINGRQLDADVPAISPPTPGECVDFMSRDADFLSDSLIREIIAVTDDRCCCLLVHLDLKFNQIDHVIQNSPEKSMLIDAFEQLMLEWRDENRQHNHRGVPKLLSALRRGGKYDVGLDVQRRLKLWSDDVSATSPLKDWTKKAYTDTSILMPAYYPRPLSDGFFMQIAPSIDPNRAFAFSLQMSSVDWVEVYQQHYNDRQVGYCVMKMLTGFRDTGQQRMSEVDQLETILSSLGRHGYRDAQRIAFSSIRGWLKWSREQSILKTESRDLLRRMGQLRNYVSGRIMTPDFKYQCRQRLTTDCARKIFRSDTFLW